MRGTAGDDEGVVLYWRPRCAPDRSPQPPGLGGTPSDQAARNASMAAASASGVSSGA